jgi:hypothetical protein
MRVVAAALVALVMTSGGCGIVMDASRSALLDQSLADATAVADLAKSNLLSPDTAVSALANNATAMKTFSDAPWYQVLANPTYRQYLKQSAALMVVASGRAKAGKLTLPMECAYLQAEAQMFKQIKDACNGVATEPTPILVNESAIIHAQPARRSGGEGG